MENIVPTKWAAKTETRNYHGQQIKEKRFKNVLFDSNLKTYSQLDASLKGHDVAPTPITLQTYGTLEKRLEIALFRSMFASSVSDKPDNLYLVDTSKSMVLL